MKLPLRIEKLSLVDADDLDVASTIDSNFTPAVDRENLATIARAVNHHAALVAALEKLLGAHEAYHFAAQAEVIGKAAAQSLFEEDETVIEARTVLATAKGGADASN